MTTTRQLINRRFWLFLLGFTATAIGLGVLKSRLPDRDAPLLVVPLAVVGFTLWANMARTACLSCGKRLGWRALGWRNIGQRLIREHCPHCRTSIDHELQHRVT